MGWMDAPEVGGGAAWEKAPVEEDVVMTTPDGGRDLIPNGQSRRTASW